MLILLYIRPFSVVCIFSWIYACVAIDTLSISSFTTTQLTERRAQEKCYEVLHYCSYSRVTTGHHVISCYSFQSTYITCAIFRVMIRSKAMKNSSCVLRSAYLLLKRWLLNVDHINLEEHYEKAISSWKLDHRNRNKPLVQESAHIQCQLCMGPQSLV